MISLFVSIIRQQTFTFISYVGGIQWRESSIGFLTDVIFIETIDCNEIFVRDFRTLLSLLQVIRIKTFYFILYFEVQNKNLFCKNRVYKCNLIHLNFQLSQRIWIQIYKHQGNSHTNFTQPPQKTIRSNIKLLQTNT